eukprot:TRINITY_DN3445_c0_g2_i2.p1 TRINITY_DN3445_c0_g2~~TRINITY_DN3445_c0_g2_i2.p1  ORF type:complete len:264 (+),score=64.00 TRINITY_DN3445_c0_g2_i2:239-1030(+)
MTGKKLQYSRGVSETEEDTATPADDIDGMSQEEEEEDVEDDDSPLTDIRMQRTVDGTNGRSAADVSHVPLRTAYQQPAPHANTMAPPGPGPATLQYSRKRKDPTAVVQEALRGAAAAAGAGAAPIAPTYTSVPGGATKRAAVATVTEAVYTRTTRSQRGAQGRPGNAGLEAARRPIEDDIEMSPGDEETEVQETETATGGGDRIEMLEGSEEGMEEEAQEVGETSRETEGGTATEEQLPSSKSRRRFQAPLKDSMTQTESQDH